MIAYLELPQLSVAQYREAQMQSRVYSVDKVSVEGIVQIPENPPAISVSVEGEVPTTGWSGPELAPWMYIVPPEDGILDLDFVATAPTGIVLQVLTKIGLTQAFPVPQWVVGVRIHTSTNEMVAMIDGARGGSGPAIDEVLPWPWAWWAPKSIRR